MEDGTKSYEFAENEVKSKGNHHLWNDSVNSLNENPSFKKKTLTGSPIKMTYNKALEWFRWLRDVYTDTIGASVKLTIKDLNVNDAMIVDPIGYVDEIAELFKSILVLLWHQ